ncbi:hypothetical protein BCR36DRAFT_583647 [Piromyces finnis]|uniref:SH3 domain-containing protein n=1 Tax=Piromyces finnis TaxID=1754191 RepID=A0A1Y1V8U9_9FUNG|nr:hypothetical protein BCR36DRAFT_583647 [Piromyces finnis]|eukprot:ORX50053.1 hypothetical protein BCR36DRAFT_583647 [Piromyces finnis]
MNSKSILFIFALFALFSLASTNVVAQEKRNVNDDNELLMEAVKMIEKLVNLKTESDSVSEQMKNTVTEQLNAADNSKNMEEVDMVEEGNNDDLEEVEVLTVTVYEDEEEDEFGGVDGNAVLNSLEGEEDIVEEDGNGEEGVDANMDVLPELNVNQGLNVVETEMNNDDDESVDVSIDYNVDENNLKVANDGVNNYYVVDVENYTDEEGTRDSYIVDFSNVDELEKDESNAGKIVGGLAGGAFTIALIAGFGYKYTQRNKRVLLPFHEDLEKGEFFDKNSTEHIIPVWAATVKKEESEEEKEEEEKLFEVVYNYEPELPDELKLTVGDKIKIKEIYEDGWAYGYNKTTQLFGTFPSTSLGENFNPESVPQYKPEEIAVEMNDNMVEELKKKIVESN